MTPDQLRAIALEVAKECGSGMIPTLKEDDDYIDFALRFLAAVAEKAEPVAWMYQEYSGKPIVSMNPPSSFDPNELSENEVSVFQLFLHPAIEPAPQTADESTSGEHYASGSAKSVGADPLGISAEIDLPHDLHEETKGLVVQFAEAMAQKLAHAQRKYGYSDGWRSPDWMDECRSKLVEHLAKGDPRDVANYCAFLWYHKQPTVAVSAAPLPDDVKAMVDRMSLAGNPDCWDAADIIKRQQRRIAELEKALPTCDKHKPMGGARATCVVCAGIKLSGALSQISYLCGPPNEMEVSEYDTHYDEQLVVEQVRKSIAELEAQYHELIMAVGNKFQGETRHQTALRYILAAEAPLPDNVEVSGGPLAERPLDCRVGGRST